MDIGEVGKQSNGNESQQTLAALFYLGMLAANSVENFRLPLFFISQPV